MKRIGLLGCGAIGTRIALAINSANINAELTCIYDQSEKHARALADKLSYKPDIVANSHLLSSGNVDLVVEAASQDAVRDAALGVLQNRKDLMIMSVGALLDRTILEVLTDACKEFGRTIYVPSGAIAGLDGIRAVQAELDSVQLTTTKHPGSLREAKFFIDSKINPDDISELTVLFEGSAKKAVDLFPANVNVAALLSLAGLGDATHVKVIADPRTRKNTHQIRAKGAFGEMSFVIENVPDPNNSKTSRLAVLSAVNMLHRICSDDIQIGS